MGKIIDLTGQRFGRLVVIKQDTTSKRTKWICECDCGKIKSIQATHLRSGASTSCGCYQKEMARKSNSKHNLTHTSLHNRWKTLKQRCLNPNSNNYKNYGGRGIKLCEEWKEFSNFYDWSIKNGYKQELELDRINNDGNYEPSNCRWIEKVKNGRNRRNTVKIDGMPLKEFSEKYNMDYSLVHTRYYQLKKYNKEINTTNILQYASQR